MIGDLEDSFTTWQFAEEGPEDEQIREQFGEVKGLGSVADPAAISHENHKRNCRAVIDSLDSGRDSGNIMAMGPIFRQLNRMCAEVGVTAILVHHLKKNPVHAYLEVPHPTARLVHPFGLQDA